MKFLGSVFNYIYPALLSFASVLSVDICTDGFCPIEQIICFGAALATVTLVIQCTLYMILRDSQRAAILTVVLFLWTFCFGTYTDLLLSKLIDLLHWPVPSPDWCFASYCLIGIVIFWLCNTMLRTPFVSKCVNSIVIVFFLLVLVSDIARILPAEELALKAIHTIAEQNGEIGLRATYKPDIYYIILDAAGSYDTLHNLYNMQKVEFFEYLRKKGFYVATASRSNYDRTRFSLASSLNMNYLNSLSAFLPKELDNYATFIRLIQRCEVASCLKKLDYKFVSVRSGAPFTEWNLYADTNTCYRFGDQFSTAMGYKLSILRPLEHHTDFIGSVSRAKQCWAFSHIHDEQKIKGPKFVFMHILLPHQPFVFKADGSALPFESLESYQEKYSGQITYTFRSSQKMIDELLTLSKDKPPIIIVQGDHGPQLNSTAWPYSQAYLKERFGILNAYFFPGTKCAQLYNTISPVNSFRLVFNHYFQAHLPLLPDISYYAPMEQQPCDWTAWRDENK